ncbi:MAG: MFS transporter, partial [Oscillospiraceae bacterium]|nr:MFS transporter [Oscillospiraceae bacterium]
MTESKITIWNRNFICVLLANFGLCMGHYTVNPLVAAYAQFLGAGAGVMGLLSGMFFGVALAMRPVSGPMITKIDKRRLTVMVFALGALACLGYAAFQSVGMFVLFRFINGVQYSFVGSLLMTVAGDSLPPAKMASGLGVFGVGGAVGMSLAPAISMWILE